MKLGETPPRCGTTLSRHRIRLSNGVAEARYSSATKVQDEDLQASDSLIQRKPMKEKVHVVILGAGFGGIYAGLWLEKIIADPKGMKLTLINRDNFFVFTPMLHEAYETFSFFSVLFSANKTLSEMKRTEENAGQTNAFAGSLLPPPFAVHRD